ncbi:MAG: citramalate synthase, partial [Clostridia bacterium]
MNSKLYILDTTLRDGAQAAQVNFSISDKIKIIKILDDFGINYAEIGSPGMLENDAELFCELKKNNPMKFLKPVAFGSTCREGVKACDDEILKKTVEMSFEYIALFGKASSSHVDNILRVSKNENLRMISESITFCKSKNKRIIFEAEHFFDGYFSDKEYALAVISLASESGAERIVLCDTNGGTLPENIAMAVKEVRKLISVPLGIHCHNDSGLAVANTLAACKNGVSDVHGTICGIGERCGNTNLCTAIPDLQLKLGYKIVKPEKLQLLSYYSRKIADITNILFNEREPYVGKYAFAHKAGTHIDGEVKFSDAFEHVRPEDVGNKSTYLLSNQSGRAAIAEKLKAFDDSIDKNSKIVSSVLEKIKESEAKGYQYENADGSLMLLILEAFQKRKKYFSLLDFKIVLGNPNAKDSLTSALIKISVGEKNALIAEEGIGPVNAIDKALRKALSE